MRRILTIMLLMCAITMMAQEEDVTDAGPTFVPTVKVSKVMVDGDSIP